MRNLTHFGYGVKGFVLSMIETAVELTEGRVTGTQIQQVIDWGREMLTTPIELLAVGGAAVHVPYPLTWAHEQVPPGSAAFATLGSLSELPGWLGESGSDRVNCSKS